MNTLGSRLEQRRENPNPQTAKCPELNFPRQILSDLGLFDAEANETIRYYKRMGALIRELLDKDPNKAVRLTLNHMLDPFYDNARTMRLPSDERGGWRRWEHMLLGHFGSQVVSRNFIRVNTQEGPEIDKSRWKEIRSGDKDLSRQVIMKYRGEKYGAAAGIDPAEMEFVLQNLRSILEEGDKEKHILNKMLDSIESSFRDNFKNDTDRLLGILKNLEHIFHKGDEEHKKRVIEILYKYIYVPHDEDTHIDRPDLVLATLKFCKLANQASDKMLSTPIEGSGKRWEEHLNLREILNNKLPEGVNRALKVLSSCVDECKNFKSLNSENIVSILDRANKAQKMLEEVLMAIGETNIDNSTKMVLGDDVTSLRNERDKVLKHAKGIYNTVYDLLVYFFNEEREVFDRMSVDELFEIASNVKNEQYSAWVHDLKKLAIEKMEKSVNDMLESGKPLSSTGPEHLTRSVLDLARTYRQSGRMIEAAGVLYRAIKHMEEKGNSSDLYRSFLIITLERFLKERGDNIVKIEGILYIIDADLQFFRSSVEVDLEEGYRISSDSELQIALSSLASVLLNRNTDISKKIELVQSFKVTLEQYSGNYNKDIANHILVLLQCVLETEKSLSSHS